MIINHNIAALNTHRQLSMGTNAASKNMEKLSSGLKINRAGDDAAGLAISEKMRAQIRGLDMASKNAQDGISLIQTAEGALNETHAILQRMRELAVQAGNDTNADSDRAEIQKEINQLTSEINRISNTTEFNTKKLLNGGMEDIKVTTDQAFVAKQDAVAAVYTIKASDISFAWDGSGAGSGESMTIGTKAYEATAADNGIDGLIKFINEDGTSAYTAKKNDDGSITLTVKTAGSHTINAGDFKKDNTNIAPDTITTGKDEAAATAGKFSFELDVSKLKDGQSVVIGDDVFTYKTDFKDLTELQNVINTKNNYTATIDTTNNTVTLEQKTPSATEPKVGLAAGDGKTFKATLQIGANKNQTMQLDVGDMSAKTLGLVKDGATNGLEVTNGTNNVAVGSALNVLDHDNAADAVKIINDAIEKVSAERSKLGAFQNRLEHTINNLGTSSENLTAAESRIRDVDMAKEMMEFTKNNILTQASQAMLAQANQQPQGVLQLLR